MNMRNTILPAISLAAITLLSACGGSSPDQVSPPNQFIPDIRPSLSISAPAAFIEGNENTQIANFTVDLDSPSDDVVTVDYASKSGSASEDSDYTPTTGSLTFQPGETTKQIELEILSDVCNEESETVEIELSNPVAAQIAQPLAAFSITDDDPLGDPLRVGAAKRVASPTQEDIDGQEHEYCADLMQQFYLGGFGLRRVDATDCESPAGFGGKAPIGGIASDAHVRVMLVEESGSPMVAFVTLDAVGAGNIIQYGVKRAMNAAIGIPFDNIQFGATHAHSGADLQGLWGGVPYEWRQRLYTAAGEAATEAFNNMQDAELIYSNGIIDDPSFNSYRRVDDTIGTDMQMNVLQARTIPVNENDDPEIISTVVQYNAHPTKMGSDYRFIHGDYIAGLNDLVESSYPGSTSLYYNGVIADASGSNRADVPEGASREVAAVLMGEALAERAMEIIADEPKSFMPEINYQTATASIPVTNSLFQALGAKAFFNGYYDFGNATPDPDARATSEPQNVSTAITVVSRFTIGRLGCNGIEAVSLPGEASNLVGKYVRSLTPDTDVLLLGLTHNSFGYILTEDQYGGENGTTLATDPDPLYPAGYEEGVSLGPGTMPALREQAYNPLFGAPAGFGAAGGE